MELEEIPGLTSAERDAVAAYEQALKLHAMRAVGELFSAMVNGQEKGEDVGDAIKQVEEAYSRLSELAPSGTPGREGGMDYRTLLSSLQRLKIGDRDVAKLNDPPIPWKELPEARLLAFCCLDLMHYWFLTHGALDRVDGRSSKPRLYDVPDALRVEMSEEQIAGAHGDHNELQMRLHMLLDRAVDDSPDERRGRLEHLGNDCGYDFRVFISLYEDEPDYIEGFVEGCLERIREEEDEEFAHPDDVTADQLLGIWQDPIMPPEDKREMVVECLKAECEVREDTGDLWRL